MRLKSVSIKGLHKVEFKTYDFDAVNYLEGPNGSGKSTVLDAISFALTGAIPGTNKKKSDLLRHSNCDEIYVKLVVDDDGVERSIERMLSESGSTLEVNPPIDGGSDEIVPENAIPMLDFEKYFDLTANKQKEWVIKTLPKSESEVNLRTELEALPTCTLAAHEVVDAILSPSVVPSEVIDDVFAVQSALKKAKELRTSTDADEKRASNGIQALIKYDDLTPEDTTESIKSKINGLWTLKDEAYEYAKEKERYNVAQRVLSEHGDSDGTDASAFVESANARIDELRTSMEESKDKLQRIHDEQLSLTSSIAQADSTKNAASKGTCPILDIECSTLQEKVPELEAHKASLEAEYASLELRKEEESGKCADANAEIERILSEKAEAERTVNLLEEAREVIKRFEQMTRPPKTADEIGNEIHDLTDRLEKAAANEQYDSIFDKLQEERLVIKEKQAFLKDAIKLLGENGIQTKMVDGVLVEVTNNMSRLLSKLSLSSIGEPHIEASESANSFSFGVKRGDRYIPFNMLSSGEQCIMLIVYMSTLASMSDDGTGFLLVDDVLDHLDDIAFPAMLEHVKGISDEVQFVFAGVRKAPEGADVKVTKIGA